MFLRPSFTMNRLRLTFWCWLVAWAATAQVRIVVVKHPPLLIPDAPLYLAGTLNNWNPGDPAYKLTKDSAGTYSLLIPNAPDRFSYKITQGSWTLVEGNAQGNSLPDRVYDRWQEANPKLVEVTIVGWEKRIRYEFIIRKIPENTPTDASLYITGNFNNWNTADPFHRLIHSADGSWRVTIYSELDRVEYKFTRGNWQTVEGRETGKVRPNRVLYRKKMTGLA